MGNDRARGRSTAFWMYRALCSLSVGLGILFTFPTSAFATRGRVKVVNNTIVTDTGTLVRGGRVSLDIWDETPTQAEVDTMKNSRGLNAFHIYAEYPGSNKAAGYNAAKVDKVVDMADQNDLYVILTIGSGGGNGTFNGSFVTAFWNFYAPRYKDKTFVVYEVCNEPQAWSAPYNNNTLTMEKNAYTQIRGLAPDTHIMMMSYSQVVNPTQAASECSNLGVTWSNASVAFHTYGIDGKEDASLTAFYNAMKGKGIAYACTEPNLTLKAITTKLFERDGVSETQFISVHDIATNASAFSSWITSNNICWTPDFGTWPSCPGTVKGTGGTSGGGGKAGTGGTAGSPGSGGAGGRGGSGGNGAGGLAAAGHSGSGGNLASGGSAGTGTGGILGTGGFGTGGSNGSGGITTSGTGGTPTNGTGGTPTSGTGGTPTNGTGGSPNEAGDGSNGCSCATSSASSTRFGGAALLLGLALLFRARRRRG
jgi:MYXO-CTERM domain-containing protein